MKRQMASSETDPRRHLLEYPGTGKILVFLKDNGLALKTRIKDSAGLSANTHAKAMEQLEEYNLIIKRDEDNTYGLTPQGEHVARLVVAAAEIIKQATGSEAESPFENFGSVKMLRLVCEREGGVKKYDFRKELELASTTVDRNLDMLLKYKIIAEGDSSNFMPANAGTQLAPILADIDMTIAKRGMPAASKPNPRIDSGNVTRPAVRSYPLAGVFLSNYPTLEMDQITFYRYVSDNQVSSTFFLDPNYYEIRKERDLNIFAVDKGVKIVTGHGGHPEWPDFEAKVKELEAFHFTRFDRLEDARKVFVKVGKSGSFFVDEAEYLVFKDTDFPDLPTARDGLKRGFKKMVEFDSASQFGIENKIDYDAFIGSDFPRVLEYGAYNVALLRDFSG
nr:hypothetical protein [Candidatus Sigynarchaeota archaeon]